MIALEDSILIFYGSVHVDTSTTNRHVVETRAQKSRGSEFDPLLCGWNIFPRRRARDAAATDDWTMWCECTRSCFASDHRKRFGGGVSSTFLLSQL